MDGDLGQPALAEERETILDSCLDVSGEKGTASKERKRGRRSHARLGHMSPS